MESNWCFSKILNIKWFKPGIIICISLLQNNKTPMGRTNRKISYTKSTLGLSTTDKDFQSHTRTRFSMQLLHQTHKVMKWIWYEQEKCRSYIIQEEKQIKFLMGLNESFKQAVSRKIMITEPQSDLNKAYSMVTQDEQQRDIETPKESTTTLLAQAPYKPSKPQRERPYCNSCKILGHIINTNYQLHGYPTEKPTYNNQ